MWKIDADCILIKDVYGCFREEKIYTQVGVRQMNILEMPSLSRDEFESNAMTDMVSVTSTHGESKTYSASMMPIRLAQHRTVYTCIYPFIHLSIYLSCRVWK